MTSRILPLRRLQHRVRLERQARGRHTTDPVFVVGFGRSGSTLLVDYLNSLPDVTFAGEILNPGLLEGLRPDPANHRALRRHLRLSIDALDGRVRGAKILYAQFRYHGLEPEELRDLFPEVRFIVVYRRSLAEQYLSVEVSRRTGEFIRRGDGGGGFTGTLRLDPDATESYFDLVRSFYRDLLSRQWVRERSIVVAYEDMTADAGAMFREVVCPFLRVPAAPVASTMVKQIRRPLAEVVENYAELEPLLTSERATQSYGTPPGASSSP